jgi:ATP-dependent RNA helicase RhlE
MTTLEGTAGFDGLGLSSSMLHALERAGYRTPTPIQARAIPPGLAGQDVIGCAATGTGKTAAFVLPIVERLRGKTGTRALVLAPTRELALQIAQHLEMFGGHQVRGTVVIGGASMSAQIRALQGKPQVIVATPGRLVDHLQQSTADLSHLEILVLDEADRMLDMGFKPQLTRILARVPRRRQTFLFSATMAGEVAEFARAHLSAPVRIEVSRSGTTAARAEQAVYLVPQLDKAALLLALLADGAESTLVFTRTKRRADKLARVVERAGHKVARIHADRSQSQRQQALEGFRAGRYRILVATDIAARGLDVEEIGHVVNFDLPHVAEDYVHRVGRTARAAASGRASSFAAPDEAELLRGIERLTRAPLPRRAVPTDSPAFRAELERSKFARAHPGPPQTHQTHPGHGPPHPPGRHARTHPKHRPAPGHPAPAPSGGQRTPTRGTWGPQRRRR